MTGLDLATRPVQLELDVVARRLPLLLADGSPAGELRVPFMRYVQPAVEHLFLNQGKYLRPLLVLLAARAVGPNTSEARPALINAASAVELIHTASLAHDDMIDASDERRGAPSLHVAHGSTTAILVGDLLYARFFEELAGLPGVDAALRLRLLSLFLGVTRRMCEGEILADQMRQDGTRPSCAAYFFIAEAKTAELLSACCQGGALLGGATDGAAAALADYGRSLGLLFQVADDLADGDGACDDRAALAAAAEEHRRRTAAALAGFPPGDALDTLRALPERILSPARA
jgi:geranylgeranyl pyrophosphate synthase